MVLTTGDKDEREGKQEFAEGEIYACHGTDVADSGADTGGSLLQECEGLLPG